MALLRWDEEEEKKEDGFAQPTPLASVGSVQDSWQPTQAPQTTTDEQGNVVQQPQQTENYLMSEEKAQVDAQRRAQKAAEAQRRAEMARQAAIARQNEAIDRQNQENAQAQAQEQKQYKPKNAGEAAGDFFQGLAKGLWKGGAGALGSGASIVSSLFTGDADNDVTNATKQWQKSADDWGQKVHADGVGDFIGSIPGGVVSGIVDPANYFIRGVRNTPEMLAASIAAGSSDANLRKVGIEMQKELQARQFGDDVAERGDAAMLMEGVAKPGAMILNVATAGQGSVAMQVSKPVWQRIATSAAKEGIINIGAGVPISVLEQAARGQEITWESVAKDALMQGVTGTVVGGASQGYAISKNRGGIRENANMLEQELTPAERAAEENAVNEIVEDGNITFEQENIRTEAPVADGVVTPVAPDAPQYTPIADNLTPVVDDGVVTPEPLTEAPDQLNGQTPPDWDEATAREVAAVREQPAPEPAAAPVADGVTQPVRPVENMPTIKSEEVRALQEARAGKTQAEEAVINERLKELRDDTPNYFREDSEISDINRILKNEDTAAGGEPVADYYRRAKGEDWNVQEMTPDEYLDAAARAMGQDPTTWRGAHTGDVQKYAEAMRNGDKFPMPFINKVAGTQEGRTRALAAKEAGQKRMRVAVADKYTPERYAERQRFEAEQKKTQAEIERSQRMLDILNGKEDTPSVYRSEAPDRYGIGQAELGNGLYTGSKETAGRRADGTISEDGLYEYKVNPEAKVLDSSSDEFRSLDSQASTHPSLKEPGISDTEWRNRKTAILGQLVRDAGYDGVKRGTNQFVGMSERALIPVTEGAPTYRSDTDAPAVKRDFKTEEGHPISGMPTEVIKTDGGYIRILPNSPYAPENLTSIVKVMVDEDRRRQGIGSDLLKEAMKKYGRISAFAENEASQRMNYKLGMRPVDKPNATLDEVLALGREQGGGVTMVTPSTTPKVEGASVYRGDAGDKYKTESFKESEIAENIHIRELDVALETIRQRREQLIADGHSENYHGVKNLDKAADDIIRQQQDIANGIQNTATVDSENTRLFGDNAKAVGYTDSITTEGGKRAVGVTQDGAGESSIIIDRNAKNAEAVFHHEAVHKTLNDFTTPEKRADVIESYRKHHGIDKKMTNDQIEELLSDDFAKFVAAKRNKDAAKANRGDIDLPTKVKEFFEEAWQNIKAAYKSMRLNGTLTPEFQKLYTDLNNGKFANKSVIAKAADPRITNRYMVAGKNAKTFDPADKKGRNFTGIDKLTRFEIDDSTAKLSDAFIDKVKAAQKSGRGGSTVRLGDVLDHSPLFKAYPDIADIEVSIFHAAPAGGRIKFGGYIPSKDSMRLNAHPRTARELRATILHEVQHAIQEREGFIGGLTKQQQRELGRGQPAGEKYFRSADEIESRLVETRRDMSQSERDATPFYDTIPADKPIGNTIIGNEEYKTLPQVHTGTRIAEEMKAAGKKPTPNKNVVPEPFAGNLPDNLMPDVPTRATMPAPRKPRKPAPELTPEQKSINDFAKRVFSNTDLHKDFRRRLARALGLEKDTESSVGELLQQTSVKVSDRDKRIIGSKFNELERITTEYNKLMAQQRKGYQKGKTSGLDAAASKRANQLIDAYGRVERDLNGYVRKIQGKKSIGNRVANIAENLTGARNANILTSVGGVSRNVTQELGANIIETVLHPVRMARGIVQMPAEIARAYKRTAKEFTVKPKTVSEVFPYAIGNTYRFLMSPVTGIANVRKGVVRDTLAESLLRAQGENPTRAEIKKFAGAMGADSEVVANNLMGILNGMTSHGKGLEVMRAYQEFIKTGSAAAKATFLKNTETASNLAAKMTQIAAESDNPKVRIQVALMNTVFPFVNTASNLAKTAATYNLNPISRSINDEVLKAVRSNPQNVLAILKNKAVTYGVLGGVAALYEQGVIGYNDGEEIDKPKGIYIDMGDGTFHAVRATPIELPIAAVVTAAEIAKHASEGDVRPVNYYLGIIGNSLPYVDSTTNLVAAAGSAVNAYLGGDGTSGTDDNGYAAKAYGVNLAKSYVPLSNNGVIPAINSQNGKSTNAKSVYDKDIPTWFNNSVRSSFDPAFRESLKDSRDNAGRVRTVDQQGLWSGIKKNINDADTATYNDAINNLVTFGRQNGLGRGTKDMFNTYDTGKNNNFKSVQDSITFLDVEDGGKPDNAKKLENNEKLGELAAQIRDGFWGDTGAELLTLNGQNLYSDVSVPNADGTKNSRLPLNMQSIKNAIAATDLPKEQRDRMYEISQANQALYAEVESGAMTYAQYKQVKAASEQEYVDILSNSDSYKKLGALMDTLDKEGFFDVGGVGSTKSGQTYLWNSLNALLGSKGATPAAQYPKNGSGWGSGGGGGGGMRATNKPGDRNNKGIQWTPVGKREMAMAKTGKYTPVEIKVKLGNEIKKNRTQNYSDRSF